MELGSQQIDHKCDAPSSSLMDSLHVTTLALGSRPKQGLARLRAKRKPGSEGKCEGMNPHTLEGASILGIWNPGGLPNFQRAIIGVETQWIEEFFISLKIF
jgi:hypothetical protein